MVFSSFFMRLNHVFTWYSREFQRNTPGFRVTKPGQALCTMVTIQSTAGKGAGLFKVNKTIRLQYRIRKPDMGDLANDQDRPIDIQ